VLTVALDDRQIGDQGGRQLPLVDVGGVVDELAEPQDHVQRRAQLVADLGEKLLLGEARLLGQLAHEGEAFGQPLEFEVGIDQCRLRLFEV